MMRYVILVLALLIQSGCVGQKKQNDSVNDVNIFFKQYAYLLQRSLEYDLENQRFKYEVQEFIEGYKEDAAGVDTLINPFFSNSERGKPILLHPYLFNTNQDRVVIMVLTRGTMISGRPSEKVQYVLGSKENDKWMFSKKKAHVRGFHYEGGHPLLSDTEMTLRVLRTFIDWGYMPVDKVEINDQFFDKNW